MLRTINERDDYVALRVLLGLIPGVGITTCNRIAGTVVENNLNYTDLFFQPLPDGVFGRREMGALEQLRSMTTQLEGWRGEDLLGDRKNAIEELLLALFGNTTAEAWRDMTDRIPAEATLVEVRNVLWTDAEGEADDAISTIYARLQVEVPDDQLAVARLRVMTMHRAKGLSGRVVFIPGLEEEIFPGERRGRYPGLVLEAARLLYVSITRARAACFVTYARRRTRFGVFGGHAPSRYVAQLGVVVTDRDRGLSESSAAQVAAACAAL